MYLKQTLLLLLLGYLKIINKNASVLFATHNNRLGTLVSAGAVAASATTQGLAGTYMEH
jgi:hypothetical protein